MASEHHPDAPSLEFSNDSDSNCYIIDSGSKDEIELMLLDEEEEEDWNFDESDNESDDDYVSDQGYITG